MSAMCAMPLTTVQKMIGAISIRIALMKASPNGCIWAPRSGLTAPTTMPKAIAITTWTHSSCHHARRTSRRVSVAKVVAVIVSPLLGGGTCPFSTVGVELEEPFRIRHQELVLLRRIGGVKRDQVDQIAIIRHELD